MEQSRDERNLDSLLRTATADYKMQDRLPDEVSRAENGNYASKKILHLIDLYERHVKSPYRKN